MGREGLLSLFKYHKKPQNQDHYHQLPNSQKAFSTTLMEENISNAEIIISKWDVNSPQSKLSALFYDTRDDAFKFCQAVNDLQRAMVFFSSKDCLESRKSKSEYLIRAQNLMETAMKRLEKEFYQILSANRDRLDPEYISHRSTASSISDLDTEDEVRTLHESINEVEQASRIAMADLRSIAQTMICSGYGKECVKIYNMIRKSIVDEGMYRLGFEKLNISLVQKLDWEVLDLKIQSWLDGSGVAVRTLLSGERILCDQVFEGSDLIRESCFAEITKETAIQFLAFPELVAKSKKSPEKLFRLLDLYNSVSDLWIDIESVFSYESTESVRTQALSTFVKLGEAVRCTISEFEMSIQKDGSKNPVPGGGIHPLTRYAMKYLQVLADYEVALSDIYLDFPIQASSPLPESFFDSSTILSPSSSNYESTPSSVSIRIAWLQLVLLCKLDGKAENYKHVALSYLFLTNNLQYILKKVKQSKLRQILGEDWIFKHESKVKHYASSYERLGWARVAMWVPVSEPVEIAEQKIKVFYGAFEEAIQVQNGWVVEDENMRALVKELVSDMIISSYQVFYETYHPIFCDATSSDVPVIRYAPEDLRVKIMELFSGANGSGSDISVGSNKSFWRSIAH